MYTHQGTGQEEGEGIEGRLMRRMGRCRTGNRQKETEAPLEQPPPPLRAISLWARCQMKIPKDNGNTNDWLDTKKNYNWKKRGAPAKKKPAGCNGKGVCERRKRRKEKERETGNRRKREGTRTIGNNISIPIEPTHTNATVRWGCFRRGKGCRGLLDRRGRVWRGTRGRSERVKNITPSHTGATSRMKRTLTNTNNGRHKRTAG